MTEHLSKHEQIQISREALVREEGIEKGKEEGREEGIGIGREEERTELIFNMYENGISIPKIADITHCSKKEIIEVIENNHQ